MAILFCDGFDQYGVLTDAYAFWSATTGSPSAEISDDTPYGRGKSVKFNNVAGLNDGLRIPLGQKLTTLGCAFHIKISEYPLGTASRGIIEFYLNSSGAQCSLALNNNGQIRFVRSEGNATSVNNTLFVSPNALPLNEWVHVEFKVYIANSGGYGELRVNGNVEATISNIDTQDESNGGCDLLRVGNVYTNVTAYAPGAILIDNFVCWDASGTQNNDFLGEVEVATLFPNADVDITDWTPSSGSDGYAMIDEDAPDGDDTYIYSDVEDAVAQFELSSLPSGNMKILAVQPMALARKDDSGERGIQIGVVSDEEVAEADPFMLGLGYAVTKKVFEIDPATDLSWEKSAVNALQIRAKVI